MHALEKIKDALFYWRKPAISYRNQEWRVFYGVTAIAVALGGVAFLAHAVRSLLLVGAIYACSVYGLILLFPLVLPENQRRRDPLPLDTTMLRGKNAFAQARELLPKLRIVKNSGSHNLWENEVRGEFGVWTVQLEEVREKLVAYRLKFGHYRTISLSTEEAWSGFTARFIKSGGDGG